MTTALLTKIVSGGQTGVDRAALDAAKFLKIAHGGWCPKGRRSENGRIPDEYALTETHSRDYLVRTEQNVIDSDGTLILYRRNLSGGTKLTVRFAKKHGRPVCCIDLELTQKSLVDNRDNLLGWLEANQIGVLNVAGPRESNCEGIAIQAEQFLTATLLG